MTNVFKIAAVALSMGTALAVGAAHAAPIHEMVSHTASVVQAGYWVNTCSRIPIYDNFGLIVGWQTVCG
jgi:hypothetical protein